MQANGTDTPQRGFFPALGWACFLGSSWTWVIGMFFPLLLVRDYGVPGWFVFAIPNVVGAAAMGFVLRDRASSQRLVTRHAAACRWFSDVTIAFHLFMLGWAIVLLFGPFGLAAFGLTVAWLVLRAWAGRTWVAAAVTVSAISFICFIAAGPLPGAWGNVFRPGGTGGFSYFADSRLWHLAMFAPASIAGFALCPYLDLTFHRARQATDVLTGRVAFAVGFGVVFLTMIVFSLMYADVLLPVFNAQGPAAVPSRWWPVLLVHICVQAAFTVVLHVRETLAMPDRRAAYRYPLLLAAVAGLVAVAWYDQPTRALGPNAGELVYRSFLLFYGLVAPTYVFIVMLPMRRVVSPRMKIATFVFATLAALPLAVGGFVFSVSWWVPISLTVPVVARAVLEISSPRP